MRTVTLPISIGANSHPTVLGDEGAYCTSAKGAGGLPVNVPRSAVCRLLESSALRTTVVSSACLTPADPASRTYVQRQRGAPVGVSGASVSESALADCWCGHRWRGCRCWTQPSTGQSDGMRTTRSIVSEREFALLTPRW